MKATTLVLILLPAIVLYAVYAGRKHDSPRVPTSAQEIRDRTLPARVLLSKCMYRDGGALPDPKCTPGAVNHAVTQATISKTICVKGWTATVRPPSNVTGPEKLVSMRAYDYGRQFGAGFGTSPQGYEFDHLIPLELGGATNDARNLWPEPHATSFVKDGVEGALKAKVCAGKVKLAAARRAIRTNWKIAIP